MFELYFRFRFLRLRHHRHVILHLPIKFRPDRTIRATVMTSYRFFQDGRHGTAILLPVSVFVISLIWEGRNIPAYNFGEVSQSTAKIVLLPVSKNKRPPFWNSTSGSSIYACVTMGMSFCICLPNFVQIGPSATEL